MNPFIGQEAAELFERYLRIICAESDRGAVLVAASLLDAGLETLLKKKLVADDGKEDSLFSGGNAPLRSFSSKIDLAFRLGLITCETKQMFTLFRRLRNDFAHGVDQVAFSQPGVKDRLRAMLETQPELYAGVHGTFNELLQQEGMSSEFLETPRGRREVLNVFFAGNAMALRRTALQVVPIAELT